MKHEIASYDNDDTRTLRAARNVPGTFVIAAEDIWDRILIYLDRDEAEMIQGRLREWLLSDHSKGAGE